MLYHPGEEGKEMVEAKIREYLANSLNNIPVYMEYPKNPPKQFILLQVADGGQTNHIDAVTFFVTICADSLYAAAELKEAVKTLLFDAVIIPGITTSNLGSERAGTDQANHVYTYELTFNFYYYREEL